VGHRARGAVLVEALQDASVPSFASMGLQLSSELRGLSISSAASNDARAESPCTAAPYRTSSAVRVPANMQIWPLGPRRGTANRNLMAIAQCAPAS
jgi:hypothetical protein